MVSKLVFIKTMDTFFFFAKIIKSDSNQIPNKVLMVKSMADIEQNPPPEFQQFPYTCAPEVTDNKCSHFERILR